MLRVEQQRVARGTGDANAAPEPELVLIPGGEFTMGDDGGRPDKRPEHRVVLQTFRAAVSPVTNAEYGYFVRATGADAPPSAADPRFNADELPVVGVSWFDAVAYIDWLTSTHETRFRLPTEAEREYAARSGSRGAWPWDGELEAHPGYERIAHLDQPHAPSPACANGFGLRCMGENVHEWCRDWHDARYYAESPREMPGGPADGRRRASRGGSWRHAIKFARITARSSIDPSFHYNDYGFRVYAGA